MLVWEPLDENRAEIMNIAVHPDQQGKGYGRAMLQFAIGNRNWIQMIVIAVIMDALLYVVMRYGFGVPVPGPQLF